MLNFYNVYSIRKRIVALAVLTLLAAAAGPGTAGEPTAAELFRQVEDRFAALTSLAYTVQRTVTSKRQQSEDQWRFRYSSGGFIRVDYQLPHERIIILDDTTLVEYIPSLKRAMRTDLAALPEERKRQAIAAVVGRVNVEGLRLGNYREMEKKAVKVSPAPWAGKDVFLVEGADPRYLVYIDRDKRTLLRTEIYDKDRRLVLRTESARFVETAKGFWMPQEILASYSTPEGFVQAKMLLRDIRINEPVSEDVFRMDLPKGVEIIPN